MGGDTKLRKKYVEESDPFTIYNEIYFDYSFGRIMQIIPKGLDWSKILIDENGMPIFKSSKLIGWPNDGAECYHTL